MLLNSLINGCHNMRKSDRIALTNWAIEYCKPTEQRNPSLAMTRSANQALAVEIHRYMRHGEWRTSTAIANELKKPLSSVRLVMVVIREAWKYEVSRNPKKGYRRLNNVNQHELHQV
jgi:hypothetical protein